MVDLGTISGVVSIAFVVLIIVVMSWMALGTVRDEAHSPGRNLEGEEAEADAE